MEVALHTHPDMLDHRPGDGHAERPERLRAVIEALEDDAGLDLERFEAPLVDFADLALVHPQGFIDAILAAAPRAGRHALDPDTVLSAGSLTAARRAAGAVVAATRAVADGQGKRAFCAVRPPGHHAEPSTAMGFCLFSNIAVAARVAQAAGLKRVAIVDFDVHHGNGTQAAFEHDPSVFFASIHQSPLYPGTGDPSETGVGNVANAIVAPHAPREVWRKGFEGLMDRVDGFAPELILVSAGFDAHVRDPLAAQSLEAEDFAWATRAIASVANRRCGGRIVSSLEGGYDLEALGRSAAAHVKALQEG
ncbi:MULTISPECIES: histone deacetylase family protein [Caulobacter]|jgi:acetoin utilization deacetylase AcuC-like enzyme|uniref:Acetoin utilization deacetylase AcuC-like enzyme n=1 Tax=Caulobacter rhizosphaerae TaxID=2010972 RepID=A0ABU1N059_9CAUL|nr:MULTISPECIES: histone deacetylase family protein [Caulobacter]KQZ18228.1 acetoin utilization protein [Caulobacter sp. Root1472]MDR6531682.1 acetoin utilization deacetylase AcuC-like enzyme [Caulobacter rhizosphaerae]GGL39145.1 acetoin utilization protein [Caulobacter rhizosphaerae]